MSASPSPPSGVLERGLYLLSFFTQQQPSLHLKELAELSGLDKATTLRALKILTAWNYLKKRPNGAYSPGPANLRMAALYRQSTNFVRRIEAVIGSLSGQVGQTTSFFVRSGENRVCIARDQVYRDFSYYIEVGASVPLSGGGAASQLLLAYTEAQNEAHECIRSAGRYISRGERNRHLASVAVPVFEMDGQFLGALTITGMALDLDDETLTGFAQLAKTELTNAGFAY